MPRYDDYPEVVPLSGIQFFELTGKSEYSAVPASTPVVAAKKEKRICGLTKGVFATIVGLVVLLVGAAIGGGIGAGVAFAHFNNKLTTLQNATSSTSTSTSTPPSIPVSNTFCGASNFTSTYTAQSGFMFNKYCDYDVQFFDLVSFLTLGWEHCMEACGRYNAFRRNTSDPNTCMGLTFVPSWIDETAARSNISRWENCFLKYYIPDLSSVKSGRPYQIVMSTLRSL